MTDAVYYYVKKKKNTLSTLFGQGCVASLGASYTPPPPQVILTLDTYPLFYIR